MQFTLHTIESAPEAARGTLASIEERYSFIPNLAAVFAESPASFSALLGLMDAYDDEHMTLSPLERQVVLLSTSVANRCEYCTAAHSMLAEMNGLAREGIDKLQQGESLSNARLETLRRFVEGVVEQRGLVTKSELNAFTEAGFNKAQLLEVICGVAMKTLTNYVNHIAHPPVNEQFAGFLPNWNKAV